MKCVIFAGGGTGGHLYPAITLGEAVASECADVRPHYVGARRGIEADVLPSRGVPHTLLPIEPIDRGRPWRNAVLPVSMGRSALILARLFHRLAPRLVVGTGGYASGPACGWAILRGVPVALQEQNAYPGLTTRWLSRWARQVHLGFPEAEAWLSPGRRTEVFAPGNPIRSPANTPPRHVCRQRFELPQDAVVVLIVGGSQGARTINDALVDAVLEVVAGRQPKPDGVQLLWATGPAHLEAVRGRLGTAARSWVRTVGYIDEMPVALGAADLAISRAGAMQTAELAAWGVPAILVPLPSAAADHQTRNARALADAGAAIHVPETGLTAERLWRLLLDLAGAASARDRMARAARSRSRTDAAEFIARRMLTLVRD